MKMEQKNVKEVRKTFPKRDGELRGAVASELGRPRAEQVRGKPHRRTMAQPLKSPRKGTLNTDRKTPLSTQGATTRWTPTSQHTRQGPL